MPAVIRKNRKGYPILVHPCDECGSNNAPYGFRYGPRESRWYCAAHREVGEAWLRGGA